MKRFETFFWLITLGYMIIGFIVAWTHGIENSDNWGIALVLMLGTLCIAMHLPKIGPWLLGYWGKR